MKRMALPTRKSNDRIVMLTATVRESSAGYGRQKVELRLDGAKVPVASFQIESN